ncbi:hypothetical protein O9G_002376 [Rozella allomycis CSF55]|uniref:Uncharacterized protein n=1 Tax=Rozella allomycis (strain CSF55) TaxID=988480 RepID=A0A075ATZ6_ROZAC|nr:hypothetical protein O9G_002376 [Rozella allomycis CSF55]|eukprot:EPZ33738.1 hypothetical protein O9G_002376 [Rozella allomycis CSF55]
MPRSGSNDILFTNAIQYMKSKEKKDSSIISTSAGFLSVNLSETESALQLPHMEANSILSVCTNDVKPFQPNN